MSGIGPDSGAKLTVWLFLNIPWKFELKRFGFKWKQDTDRKSKTLQSLKGYKNVSQTMGIPSNDIISLLGSP